MIVSSEIFQENPQIDGRVYIKERHVDHVGREHFTEYLAGADADHQSVMLARVPLLEARMRQSEIDSIEEMVLNGIAAIDVAPPVYVTPAEVYAYLFIKFSAEPNCIKLLKAAHFTDIFTDDELLGYGMSLELIATVRQKAGEIQMIAASVDSYVPPIAEEIA